jgi:hypothetical protein
MMLDCYVLQINLLCNVVQKVQQYRNYKVRDPANQIVLTGRVGTITPMLGHTLALELFLVKFSRAETCSCSYLMLMSY